MRCGGVTDCATLAKSRIGWLAMSFGAVDVDSSVMRSCIRLLFVTPSKIRSATSTAGPFAFLGPSPRMVRIR